MRFTLGLPLALAAGVALLSAPAMADDRCPPSSVLTIKSLQGGGGNAARQAADICANVTDRVQSRGPSVAELYSGNDAVADAGSYNAWPEAEIKQRQRGF